VQPTCSQEDFFKASGLSPEDKAALHYWFLQLEHVLSAYHIKKDATGAPITIDVKAEPRASALAGELPAREGLREADEGLEWLADIHKQSNGPYLFLCAGMGPLPSPNLSAADSFRFCVRTDLYICLCLRKVAQDMNKASGSSHMPLFLFFDGAFDDRTVKLLEAQHFVALADNFVWPDHDENSAKVGTNDGIKKVFNMIRGTDQRNDAEVRLVASTMQLLTKRSRNGSITPSVITVLKRCHSFYTLPISSHLAWTRSTSYLRSSEMALLQASIVCGGSRFNCGCYSGRADRPERFGVLLPVNCQGFCPWDWVVPQRPSAMPCLSFELALSSPPVQLANFPASRTAGLTVPSTPWTRQRQCC
jgi:hypothetical protein